MRAVILCAIFIITAVLALTLLPIGLELYEYEQQQNALRDASKSQQLSEQ